MKINKNSYLFSIFFTFAFTIVLVFPLTLANTATKPIADDYWRVQRFVKTLKALGIPAVANKPEDARQAYAKLEKYTIGNGKLIEVTPEIIQNGQLVKVTDDQIDKAEVQGYPINPLFYVTQLDGQKRFAGSFTGPGLWGNVTLALGVNQNIDTIQGLQVLYQVETPGLGGRIGEKWFTEQFNGLKPGSSGLEFNISGAKKENGFDAITGATITSVAVRDIVNNRALPALKGLKDKVGDAP